MTNSRFENIWRIIREYKITIDNDIGKEFICSICEKVMIKACSSPCGCRYCFECIATYLDKGNQFCPGKLPDCQDEMIIINENILIDNVINNNISKLIVKCPRKSCEHKAELRNIDDHIRACQLQSVNCPYFNFGCDKDTLEGNQLKDHLEIENYRHTKLLIEFVDNLRNEIELLKREIAELREENNNQKLDGDRRQVEIGELTTNAKINDDEVKLLNEEMVALKNDNRSMKEEIKILKNKMAITKDVLDQVDQSNKEIISVKQENLSLKSKLETLINEGRQNQVMIRELRTSLDEQSQQDIKWRQKCKETSDNCNKIKRDVDENLEIIKDLKNITDTNNRKTCKIGTDFIKQNEFVWIIPNICEKIKPTQNRIATQISSGGFYTHNNGYRMCLCICPCQAFLSLSFHLMRGIFDNILPWPFKHDVTLSLMNQQTGLVHLSSTSKFKSSQSTEEFLKPTKETNPEISIAKFIKLNEILSSPALMEGNQIIIKCTVHTLR